MGPGRGMLTQKKLKNIKCNILVRLRHFFGMDQPLPAEWRFREQDTAFQVFILLLVMDPQWDALYRIIWILQIPKNYLDDHAVVTLVNFKHCGELMGT